MAQYRVRSWLFGVSGILNLIGAAGTLMGGAVDVYRGIAILGLSFLGFGLMLGTPPQDPQSRQRRHDLGQDDPLTD